MKFSTEFKSLAAALLAAFALYLLIAVVITFPLVLNLSTQMIGHHTGDAYEMGHHIWWFKYALQNGEPLFYQTLMAYPDGLQGISLWSNPTQFFPAWLFAFFMPVAAAYNVTLLLTMALNGLAMYGLMRYLLNTSSTSPQTPQSMRGNFSLPAFFAGLVFMAFPVFQGHLFGGHAGLMVQWGVPLLIYALLNLVDTPTRKWFILSVIFYLLAPSGHTLQVIYALLPIMGLFVLWRLIVRDWRGVRNVVLVGVVGTVLLGIFLIPVVADTFADDTYSGAGGYIDFSTDLLGIVSPSFFHPVFGQLEYTHRVLGINITEGFTYIGFVGGLLALVGAWVYRGSRAGWFVALALLTWVLALGPVLKVLNDPVILGAPDAPAYLSFPWAFIYDLPGFNLARTPGRFTFAFAVAVAALAGYGMAAISARLNSRAKWLALIALSAFMLWEYQGFFPYPTVDAGIPQAVLDLKTRDDVRAVMDMPWGNLLAAKHGIYLQTGHQKPLIAGQVTRRTPVSAAKLNILESTLDRALMDAQNIDVVILHKQYADAELTRLLRRRFGDPYFEDGSFALFDVPDAGRELRVRRFFPTQTTFSTRYEAAIFAPEPLSVTFSGVLSGSGRVEVQREGETLETLVIEGETAFEVPVSLPDAGFYTVALVVVPECPQRVTTIAATCPTLMLSDVSLSESDG